jgi:hypothetical protein
MSVEELVDAGDFRLARESLERFATLSDISLECVKSASPPLVLGDDWIDDGLRVAGETSYIVRRDPLGTTLHVELDTTKPDLGNFVIFGGQAKNCRFGSFEDWTVSEAREVAELAEAVATLTTGPSSDVASASRALQAVAYRYERLDRIVAFGLALGVQKLDLEAST